MKKLYIVDLFKNLIHNKNIFALIYLVMNLFVVCACFYYVLGQTFDAILLGLLILLLLVGALKIVIGALLATVNPRIGAFYTFFFATITS